MKEGMFILFGSLSFVALAAAIFFALKHFYGKNRGKKILTSLHVFTLGVFGSAILLFLPIYYCGYNFGDSYTYLRPALISVHHALRVFILDSEFDTIRKAVSSLDEWLRVLFSLHAGILYVLAPVLTFSNVLSLFKTIKNEFFFFWHRRRPFFIFSELNERSVTLAESIVKAGTIKKPVMVFTDVFEQDDEDDYELLLRAHDMRAILLKKDITRLNATGRRSRVEFFLIGENESENLEQAIKLTEEYKNDCQKRPISIFVYSNKPSAGYIIDSIKKGNYTFDNTLAKSIADDPKRFLNENLYSNQDIDSGFYIRRVNSVEALAQDALKQKKVIDALFKDNPGKTISVAIFGMGSYGREFLKQALCLYQIFGYKTEINVFDALGSPSGASGGIVKILGHEWPEIITDVEKRSFVNLETGDCNYDIQFFEGVDCFSADLDRLFEPESPFIDRLKRTQLVIVSLGEDDKNIDAAVMLRTMFDRLKTAPDGTVELSSTPMILSIVYDDKKASNLDCNQNGVGIINYNEEPLQIDFIGKLSSQYSYDKIEKRKAIEKKALRYHLDWVRRDEAQKKNETQEDQGKSAEEIKTELATIVAKKTKAYMDFEYYRDSSIARAINEEFLAGVRELVDLHSLDDRPDHPGNCLCEYCAKASVTEHMRWNAYMRTLGYRYSPHRSDRAKLHNDLKPWNDLPDFEKEKDFETL